MILRLPSLAAASSLFLALGACAAEPQTPPPPLVASGVDAPAAPPSAPPDSQTTSQPVAAPEPTWTGPALAERSAGCGTPHAVTAGASYTTPSGRTFHVWAPAAYDADKAYPVVLAFHGWYSNGKAFQSWFQMDQYVEGAALVVYPDAVDGVWDLSGNKDLAFFDEMTTALHASYCTNPSRVLGFGFSYGGKFMNHLGCKRAGHVKAISIGDGSDGGDGQGCGRLPVLVTHRTKDHDELVSWGRATASQWASRNGCSADTQMSDAAMNCTTHASCSAPGSVTFCEDTFFDPGWPTEWNHTVRETYRAFTWKWFAALP
jgi:poly(3-hydroxybutyrate) depolymerase